MSTLPESPILEARKGIHPDGLLEDFSLFLVLHVLDDLEPLIDAWLQLGCDPATISLVGIPYSSRTEPADKIRSKGCHVELPPFYPFDAVVLSAFRDLAERAATADNKIIVVEDGGYTVPALGQLVAADRLDRTIVEGAVEQTTRGIRLAAAAERASLLPWPVISIPDCGSKENIEPQYISEAVLRNLSLILGQLEEMPSLDTVGMFGFGTIGEEIARAFRTRGAQVFVSETSAKKRYRALALARFALLDLDRIGDCDLIVGTTGFTSIGLNVLERAKDGAVVMSSSSRRVEADVDWLLANSTSSEVLGPRGAAVMGAPAARRFAFAVEGGTKAVTLLYDGYPVNFWAESLPAHVGDAVMTLLYEGVCAIAAGGLRQPGVIPGSTVIGAADQDIFELWLREKPDDGIDPTAR